MKNTKEKILCEALKLFSRNGYEAVSVRDIAGTLGITQGALYKHYAGKRDLFNSILRRMEGNDAENARRFSMPEETFGKSPESYRKASLDALKTYTEAVFRYWTEDEFASEFRKMLTLEQYRTPEMSDLYQNYLGRGVLNYLQDLFRTMNAGEPRLTALEFYAPVSLLMTISDSGMEQKKLRALLRTHLKQFTFKKK